MKGQLVYVFFYGQFSLSGHALSLSRVCQQFANNPAEQFCYSQSVYSKFADQNNNTFGLLIQKFEGTVTLPS